MSPADVVLLFKLKEGRVINLCLSLDTISLHRNWHFVGTHKCLWKEGRRKEGKREVIV